jgi:hypothetical protein
VRGGEGRERERERERARDAAAVSALTFTVCTSWMATCTSARMEDLTRSMCRVDGATTTSGEREGEEGRGATGRKGACSVRERERERDLSQSP